jgi:hypothetical protein
MATAMRKLPNLKICVENTDDLSESEDEIVVEEEDDLREEGEIDDSTDESGDDVQFSVSIRDAPSGTKSMFRVGLPASVHALQCKNNTRTFVHTAYSACV